MTAAQSSGALDSVRSCGLAPNMFTLCDVWTEKHMHNAHCCLSVTLRVFWVSKYLHGLNVCRRNLVYLVHLVGWNQTFLFPSAIYWSLEPLAWLHKSSELDQSIGRSPLNQTNQEVEDLWKGPIKRLKSSKPDQSRGRNPLNRTNHCASLRLKFKSICSHCKFINTTIYFICLNLVLINKHLY